VSAVLNATLNVPANGTKPAEAMLDCRYTRRFPSRLQEFRQVSNMLVVTREYTLVIGLAMSFGIFANQFC
jgi:hypothetical protein